MEWLWHKDQRAKVSREEITCPKQEGGLGIIRMDVWNKAIMARHIWNICCMDNFSLWVDWVKTYLIKEHSFGRFTFHKTVLGLGERSCSFGMILGHWSIMLWEMGMTPNFGLTLGYRWGLLYGALGNGLFMILGYLDKPVWQLLSMMVSGAGHSPTRRISLPLSNPLPIHWFLSRPVRMWLLGSPLLLASSLLSHLGRLFESGKLMFNGTLWFRSLGRSPKLGLFFGLQSKDDWTLKTGYTLILLLLNAFFVILNWKPMIIFSLAVLLP